MNRRNSSQRVLSIEPRAAPAKAALGLLAMFVVSMAGLAGILWTDPRPRDPAAERMVAYFLAAGVVALLLWSAWQFQRSLRAEDAGLRLHRPFGSRFWPWAEVTDFYFTLTPKRQKLYRIDTTSGSIVISPFWSVPPEFLDAVSKRATRARASEWEIKGIRAADPWPLIFTYDTRTFRIGRMGLLAVFAIVIGFWVARVGLNIPHLVRDGGWVFGLSYAALLGVSFMFLPLLYLFLWNVQNPGARVSQQITATPERIRFHDSSLVGMIDVPWSEINSIYCADIPGRVQVRGRWVVETTSGTFDFTMALKNATILVRLLEREAGPALERGLKEHCGTELIATSVPANKMGDHPGQQWHHYRTRTNRALLWLPSAMLLGLPLIQGVRMLLVGEAPPLDSMLLPAAILGFISLWGWWRYYTAGILIDDDGISQHSLTGWKRLEWKEIRSYERRGDDSLWIAVVKGESKSLGFSPFITDLTDLMDEIQRRAVSSETTEWNQPST